MKNIGFAAVAAAALAFALPAGAVTANEPFHAWVTDGSVYAVAATPREVLLGGDFTLIGRETGSWVAVDANGTVPQAPPAEYEPIDAAASDGARGWFLLTGGEDEPSLVHLLPDRTEDARWKLDVNGSVHAIASRAGVLYVAGDFTKVAGQLHRRIAAIDLKTRKPLKWDAEVTAKKAKDYADVNTLALSGDGSTLYFGGEFRIVRGNVREGMAAIATATGKVTKWAPSTDGEVYDLTASGRVVYVAGDFTKLDGRSRTELGAVAAGNGAITDWNPKANGAVSTVVASPAGPVFVGGTFTSVGGKSRRGMAAIDPKSGDATAWDANVGGAVYAILVSGKTVYFGGEFDSVAAQARANLAAADAATGAP